MSKPSFSISQNVLEADDEPPERSNDNEAKLPEFVNVFSLKPVEDFQDKKEHELCHPFIVISSLAQDVKTVGCLTPEIIIFIEYS